MCAYIHIYTCSTFHLANIFHLDFPAIPRPQIRPKRAAKQLLEHLKAHARQRSIVPPFTRFITDKRIYEVVSKPACNNANINLEEKIFFSLRKKKEKKTPLTLRPRMFIKRKPHARLMQRLANQIAPRRRHMVIQLAKYKHELCVVGALCEFRSASERVVRLAEAERVRVQVGGEVALCGCDAGVERAAVGEVAAETHAYCEGEG